VRLEQNPKERISLRESGVCFQIIKVTQKYFLKERKQKLIDLKTKFIKKFE